MLCVRVTREHLKWSSTPGFFALRRSDVHRRDCTRNILVCADKQSAGRLLESIQPHQGGYISVFRNYLRPAPRWSHYVDILRDREGPDIVTIEERHGGPYAGRHGRYQLRTPIYIVERVLK
jgi:hypothetical protein